MDNADQERFLQAIQAVLRQERDSGIGTLGEKTLHAVLKCYFEPFSESREIKIGRYVADIVGEDGVIEIQTRGFERLKTKLEAFLAVGRVTVVYPVAAVKWVAWIDEETGEVGERHKSPKKRSGLEVFRELEKIKTVLNHPNLTLCVVLLEAQEYRRLNGWSRDKKRGSTRFEMIPLRLIDQIKLEQKEDYRRFLPPSLPEVFTAKDFCKQGHIALSWAQSALRLLTNWEIVTRIGKKGNAYLYQKAVEKEGVPPCEY